MLIYDIACQYMVHMWDHINHLLPAGLDIDSAIGLFHIHGHKDICFFRYATLFIPGAGVVAGEILESLWAALNAVTPAMHMATLAHCAEIMDDHMTDSNHKKALGMGKSSLQNVSRPDPKHGHSSRIFEQQICASCSNVAKCSRILPEIKARYLGGRHPKMGGRDFTCQKDVEKGHKFDGHHWSQAASIS